MSDDVLLGTRKRGDDWTFRTIRVKNAEGQPIDLTEDGWSVACQLRPGESSSSKVTPSIREADLAAGGVVLQVAKEVSEKMEPRLWAGDLQVDGPDGRRSSSTFVIEVVRDVTHA